MVSAASTILIVMKKYERICPDCAALLTYKTYRNWWFGNKNNIKCRACCQKGKIAHNKIETPETLERVCSQCKIPISYKNRTVFLRAERNNSVCRSCNCKNYNKTRIWSEKSKAKVRNTKAQNRLKKGTQKCFGNINPKACEFLNDLNSKNGWNLIHGGNGGEQLICGYWVDGYDKERNIIVEYDEPYHYPYGKLREKDIIRQNRIISLTGCKFFRYDEKNQRLYEIT
jgi:ssDNA-binding Zn-finger/Zn-ribbon topoisomerase 1